MKRTFTVFDEDGHPVQMFPAPADRYVARNLWIFLVENLRPGLVVQLATVDDNGQSTSEITRPTGRKVPPALYAKLMGTDALRALGLDLEGE